MMIDIAQGVRAINEKLIHRDIKPDNILIEDKMLKISDFGISKFVDESTRLYTFKGRQHIAYMAPEGWVNERNTYKLDVYAVGLVFFQILTLQHPLSAKVKDPANMSHWEKAHLYEACPNLRTQRDDLPMSLVQLISRMVAKRPQDRPGWDNVLKILSDPAIEPAASPHAKITEAVAAALAKQQHQERQNLESARKQQETERAHLLYSHSCKALLERLQPVVEQFNREFQLGKIEVREEYGVTYFRLPTGNSVQVAFFAPFLTGLKIRRGIVIGGGWIGLASGRSANLVLLGERADDLYGRWAACEVKLMALVDPSKIIGRFGITAQTIQPFGFKDSYFYDQIQYATGIVHVFTYDFTDDVEGYFATLIAEGCK